MIRHLFQQSDGFYLQNERFNRQQAHAENIHKLIEILVFNAAKQLLLYIISDTAV
jgi:hypothetical protein